MRLCNTQHSIAVMLTPFTVGLYSWGGVLEKGLLYFLHHNSDKYIKCLLGNKSVVKPCRITIIQTYYLVYQSISDSVIQVFYYNYCLLDCLLNLTFALKNQHCFCIEIKTQLMKKIKEIKHTNSYIKAHLLCYI